METVNSVQELTAHLQSRQSCKILLAGSYRLNAAIREAKVTDKLDEGVQLIPKALDKILLAAICEIGTIVAKATFEGYTLGLRRKGADIFLYFSSSKETPATAVEKPIPRLKQLG